jgi:cytochrome oxidase assembly protein ShyY1
VKEWRFAFSRRWIGYFGVALVFALICVVLSHWQWERKAENLALLDKLNANYNSKPVDLHTILPSRSSYSSNDEFKQVKVTGRYLTKETLLLRDQSYNGFPGFDVLVPLQVANGDVFIVDRGWIPTGNDHDYPDSIPAPPKGEVTVVARLAGTEPYPNGRTDIPAQREVQAIDLSDIQKYVSQPVYSEAYGNLKSETPSVGTMPKLAQKPSVDYGLNLSYAIQWIMFAVAAFAFFGYAIRQEYDNLNSDEEDQRWLEETRAYRKARRGPDDRDIEDDLLDEAGYESSRPGTRISR